ncbi:TetR/AcrR family transcriptional regulator [Paenibacillus herberti]|uniref:TetR family transcriptional regulator n=1 Tax=Paenibacillus herberti TaxID=1619309 RepID=A0A229P3G7_9BACL|nr:TetR/AcrR family transcriptional regulator [Paenibacillus herberti]OXM16836.1 TetR family transcriptional regulator [Paenibacillus herberti]
MKISDDQLVDSTKTRRRGKELEAAILKAVQVELSTVGYSNLTMEGVAERSGTSKAVLYRRWPNRAELVLAAIHARVPLPLEEVPDTGNLRDDLLSMLRSMNKNITETVSDALFGLMAELGNISLAALLFPHGRQNRTMTILLQRAVERGEIRPDAIKSRILTLPVDLARHELLLYSKPMSEETITEIVDEVFLPLVAK